MSEQDAVDAEKSAPGSRNAPSPSLCSAGRAGLQLTALDLNDGTRTRDVVAAAVDASAKRWAAKQRRFNVICRYVALAGIGLAVYGIWEVFT